MAARIDLAYGALIISCSEVHATELIKQILTVQDLPAPETIAGKVSAYPWNIETKYYTANVHLFTTDSKDLISEEFAESVQAVIFHFNSKQDESFQSVKGWMPFVEKFSPAIQILSCDNCNDISGVTRRTILEWCLKHGFELVELYPEEDESDEEDDFKETKSFKRIIQALHAHTWPNLSMKERPTYHPSPYLLNLLKAEETHQAANIPVESLTVGVRNITMHSDHSDQGISNGIQPSESHNSQQEQQTREQKIDSMIQEERWLFESLGGEDPGGQSFESLFEKFKDMKERASTLTGDDRRLYAEKVAVAFWHALGGDEEEVEGLSGNED